LIIRSQDQNNFIENKLKNYKSQFLINSMSNNKIDKKNPKKIKKKKGTKPNKIQDDHPGIVINLKI